jgi:uncharacterized membrane protein
MTSARRLLAVLAGSFALVLSTVIVASAQTPVDPSTTPTENTGGWVFSMAQLLGVLGGAVVLFLIVMYMRYAPRFSKDESSLKIVRADRVRPGSELPRRAVDISQAAPVIVAPPSVPVPVGAATPASPVAAPPAPAPATPAPPPAAPAPAAAPTPPEPTSEGEAPPAPAAAEQPAAPAAPAERVEVTLDQEVFESTLAELLEKGTDRRVAEGQARRAGMIAARKKAEGG